MSKYIINFKNGEIIQFTGSLEDAKRMADNCLTETGSSVYIEDAKTRATISVRPYWCAEFDGTGYDHENPDIICGINGYFDEWIDC